MNQNGFLDYLHSFRGFAILCVVAVHAGVMPIAAFYDFGEPDKSDILFIINESLFHASTIYFAIISGLLYAAVLQNKGWKRFYRSKFLYVFLPYLFFTLLLSLGRQSQGPDDPGGLHASLGDYLQAVGMNLVYGKAMPIFWYLPVLFCLYLATPLFSWILTKDGPIKWLITPFVVAPVVISRQPIAFEHTFFWQDVLFFLGVYAVGMLVGYNLDTVIDWVEKQLTLMITLAAVTLVGIFVLYIYQPEPIGYTIPAESLHYINKILISGIVLVLFRRVEKQPKLFTIMANDAFAIYFLHFIPIFLVLSPMLPLIQNEAYYPYSVIGSIPLVFAGSLAITKGLIWLLQKLFRKYSRMIIGS